MKKQSFYFLVTRTLLLPLVLLLVFTSAKAGDDECKASGGFGFVCGPKSAEDLVLVPGTQWIIAYSRSNPARQLRATSTMALIPDNLHMDNDGRLVTAGMLANDPVCGNLGGSEPSRVTVLLTVL
jgi:hypothetical protein